MPRISPYKSLQDLEVKAIATRGGPLESKSSMLSVLWREEVSHVSLFCVCTIHGTVSQDAQYYCDKKFMALKGFFVFTWQLSLFV